MIYASASLSETLSFVPLGFWVGGTLVLLLAFFAFVLIRPGNRVQPELPTDWLDNENMTAEETLARFKALNPEPSLTHRPGTRFE